ncbi:MAG: methyltransferase domain-containing protein [Ferruginibacter sp.]
MFSTLKVFLTSFPPKIIFWKVAYKVLGIKIPKMGEWQNLFTNKSGIEIGGPSALFKREGYLPVYPIVRALDGVNFSDSTVWEGKLSEGHFYKYQFNTGCQFIAEGSYLPKIKDGNYDFVLSCNNLEHIANPIAAVLEWKRIIKKGGIILLVLPNKSANFDHKRPFTSIEHLIDDLKKNVAEDDDTHLEEILRLHDLKRDPQAGDYKSFRERCLNNYTNRCMHHHVFNQTVIQQLFQYCDLDIRLQYSSMTDHFIAAVKNNF